MIGIAVFIEIYQRIQGLGETLNGEYRLTANEREQFDTVASQRREAKWNGNPWNLTWSLLAPVCPVCQRP
jgi:hypothetical protein